MVTLWVLAMGSIADIVADDEGYWIGLHIPIANDNEKIRRIK